MHWRVVNWGGEGCGAWQDGLFREACSSTVAIQKRRFSFWIHKDKVLRTSHNTGIVACSFICFLLLDYARQYIHRSHCSVWLCLCIQLHVSYSVCLFVFSLGLHQARCAVFTQRCVLMPTFVFGLCIYILCRYISSLGLCQARYAVFTQRRVPLYRGF